MKANQPPTLAEVEAFARANRKALPVVKQFYLHYEATKWLTLSRKPLKDWKAELTRWIARTEKELRKSGY